MRILVADDQREMALALETALKRERFTVDKVFNGQDALDYAQTGDYDLVVLDIMMPQLDGLQVVQRLRQEKIATPVLLLTARGQVDDRIAGLNAGADDYLAKPFVLGEFLARVRALLRRSGTYSPSQLMSFGDLTLDKESFQLSAHGASVRLSNKEYQIMETLMRHGGRCVSTRLLMDQVWGFDGSGEVGTIWVYISNLRRRLETIGSSVCITAIRGIGYTLEAGI